MTAIPVFKDKVTMVPADWANAVSRLVYGTFGGQSTPAGVVNALGLGNMAWQNANNVQIAGGSIDNTPIGFLQPANAKFNQAYVMSAPSDPLHAVNKAYVDNAIITAQGAIVTLSQFYVARNGSTMTGMLTLAANPVLDMQAATKAYVDTSVTAQLLSPFSTYADLRQYVGSGQLVQLTGDLIAGSFYRDDTDTTTPDDGGITIVDALNRRWKRVFADAVAPEWFGAKGDGNTPDHAAFAAAAAVQRPIAMRKNAVYLFGATVTLNGGVLILRNEATIRLASGTIVNTDASHGNFTPLFRLQGMTYVDLGTTTFDHNMQNQTYPASATLFGRGTRPFLHNGSVEITPDSTGTTESAEIHVEQARFINSYLNGLVLWQCKSAWVEDCRVDTTTMSGIVAIGGTGLIIARNRGRNCGQNGLVPSTQVNAVRSFINVDYYPSGLTSAGEGIPCINTGRYANGGVAQAVEVSENEGSGCMSNTLFLRGVQGLRGGRNYSYNVGVNWKSSVTTRSTHFNISYCEGANTDNQAYQDTVAVTDYVPDGMWAYPLQGVATPFPLAGKLGLSVRGFRAQAARDSNGNPVTGLFRCGLCASSGIRATDMDISGTSADGVLFYNTPLYESPSLLPHDADFSDSSITGVASGGFFPIRIVANGSPTGLVTNVRAENMWTDGGNTEPIGYDVSITGTPINVRYSLGLANVHATAELLSNVVNGDFFRQSFNGHSGASARAGFQASGNNGQTITMSITSALGGLTGTVQTNATATGGLVLAAAAGTVQTKVGSTLALAAFASGHIGIGPSVTDDGNMLRVDGPVSVGRYTVATLPAAPNNSPLAFATNGRKVGEGAGAGTGVPVYYSNGAWRVFSTDQAVQA